MQARKYVYYNGLKFTRDDITGYYLNSTTRKRLHRYVWECCFGEIPKAYQVHHVDGDKDNNDISNLKLVKRGEHATLHGKLRAKKYYDEMVQNLKNNAMPKAAEWHHSDQGREWHKQHYQNTKDKLHVTGEFICKCCGKSFIAQITGANKFCSNKCKSKYRRTQGFDDEIRVCACCGKEFAVNKYYDTKCCSRSCANRYRKHQ